MGKLKSAQYGVGTFDGSNVNLKLMQSLKSAQYGVGTWEDLLVGRADTSTVEISPIWGRNGGPNMSRPLGSLVEISPRWGRNVRSRLNLSPAGNVEQLPSFSAFFAKGMIAWVIHATA